LDGDFLPVEEIPVLRAVRGEIIRDMRYRVITPLGKAIVLSASACPVYDARGEIFGAVSVFRDITDLVDLERQKELVYQREHHIAEVLQRALIPEIGVDIPGCRIAAKYQSALTDEARVGGDFYDVFVLSNGHLGLVMGDVSGKGLEAAVHTAMAKYYLRAYAHVYSDPGLVMARLNASLCDSTPEGLFVTVFYGVLDPSTGLLTYANGGHDEPLHYAHEAGTAALLKVTGQAVGITDTCSYAQGVVRLSPGDVLLIYTDGVTNARHKGGFFGAEGLSAVLVENAKGSEADIVESVLNTATEFAHGNLSDDAAVLVVRYDGER
jgi:sigma-B regulation protein RsbU (phosphoserine phosphatase)